MLAFIFLVLSTTLSLFPVNKSHNSLYWLILLFWSSGIFILIYHSVKNLKISKSFGIFRSPIMLIVCLALVGFILRAAFIGRYPQVIEGDAGWTGMSALRLINADNPSYNHPFSFHQGFGRLHLDWFLTSITIFGRNAEGLRLAQAVSGTLAIPTVYLFTRFAFGYHAALVAAVFTLVSNVHIHFSRSAAVGYMPGTWMAPLAGLFLLEGLKRKNKYLLTLSACILGIYLNIYLDAQVFLAVCLAFSLIYLLKNGKQRKSGLNLWLLNFLLPLLLIILPATIWSVRNYDLFMERFYYEGTFQTGYIRDEMQFKNISAVKFLSDRVIHVYQSITTLPMKNFYWSGKPFLDYLSGSLFVVGILFLIKNIKNPYSLLILIWLLIGIISIGVFAFPQESDGYRLLLIFPAIAAIIGFSLQNISNPQKYPLLLILTLLVISATNFKSYYFDFVGKCRHMNNYKPGRRWAYLGNHLAQNADINNIYLHANEERHIFGTNPAFDFLSNNKTVNVSRYIFGSLEKGWNLIYFSPNYQELINLYKENYPGGTIEVFYDCQDPILFVYKVLI